MDTGTTRKSHTRGKEWVWGVWPLRVCTGILLFLHAALMRIRVGGGGLLGGVLLGEALSGGFGGEYYQVLMIFPPEFMFVSADGGDGGDWGGDGGDFGGDF